MKQVITTFFLITLFVFAHAQTGIHFEQGLTWQQVQEKAEKKNKYVFVDCFATWCGPCKLMDKEIYPNDSVGKFFNEQFISIKMQLDTSKQDNEEVKSRYADAHHLMYAYQITEYPSFLFFSPKGELVHRGTGYQKITDFISLARNATDVDRQYFILLNNYQTGKKDYPTMPYLIDLAYKNKQKEMAITMSEDYIHNYLEKLSNKELYRKENFQFIGSSAKLIKSKDKIFASYLNQSEKIDSVMNKKGNADGLINYIIYNEEIIPFLNQALKDNVTRPDWDRITQNIARKYGKERIEPDLVSAKVRWYRKMEDWKNYSKYLVEQQEQKGMEKHPDNPATYALLDLNNNAFEIFKYSSSITELKKALAWTELAIKLLGKPDASLIDTKASLLYKLGRKKVALLLEEQATLLDPKDKGIQEDFEKMKKGTPDWVVPMHLK